MEILGIVSALAIVFALALLLAKQRRDAYIAGADHVSSIVNKAASDAQQRMSKANAEPLDTSKRLGSGEF